MPFSNELTSGGFKSQFGSKNTSNTFSAATDSLEAIRDAITALEAANGLVYDGTCDAGMAASTTAIVSADLSGLGDDFFNTDWMMLVLHNVNSDGNAPEGQLRDVTDYVSATGTFTTAAFGANVEASDKIVLVNRNQLPNQMMVDLGLDHIVTTADGGGNAYPDSVVQESIVAYILSKSANPVATSYNNTTDSLEAISDLVVVADAAVDAIQTDVGNPSARANQTSIEAMIGIPDAASSSVYNGLAGDIAAVNRVMGKTQILEVSVTAAANAGATTIATVTTQPCLIKNVVIHADAAQTADLTTCAVTGGVGGVVTFIGVADATQANLDAADKQVGWLNNGGAVRLAAAKTLSMNLLGTGATAVDLTVTIEFEACVNGGYLA